MSTTETAIAWVSLLLIALLCWGAVKATIRVTERKAELYALCIADGYKQYECYGMVYGKGR